MRPRRLNKPRRLTPPEIVRQAPDESRIKVINQSVTLKRREGPGSAIVPIRVAKEGDQVYIEGHDWPCVVIAVGHEYTAVLSRRTGEGFLVPPATLIEIIN